MSECFLVQSGGGNSLNFKVVGGTSQPDSAKENTIWVNTDVDITGWYFAAEQPAGMAEGEVWFATDVESDVAFNALKKNTVMIYPLSAKQMVSGSLVNKTAMVYQGGEWSQFSSEWNGELYEIGNQHTDKTGGWSGSGWTDYAGSYSEQSVSVGSTGIVMKVTSGTGNQACVCGTINKVSFSGYEKMAITVSSFSNDFWVGVCPNKQFWDDEGETPMLALKKITAKGTTNLSLPSGVISAYVVAYGFSGGEALTFGTVSKIQMLQ